MPVVGGSPHKGLTMHTLDYFFIACQSEQAFQQTIELPMIWDAMVLM